MKYARDAGFRVWPTVAWPDFAAVALLTALWAVLLASRWDVLPLQLWDESRNAQNALEMAGHGRWLTPTYAGAVDHWNTKPPLMIWAMAALFRLGAPPLLAVRAPALLAALATAAMLWAAVRVLTKDRFSALAAGVLLLSAKAYLGVHAASTGDYDAPESAALLAYALAAFAALETRRAGWAVLAALALAAGVLTKGVAAALALPGVALYALTQPVALGILARSRAVLAAGAAALAVIFGYYLLREAVDPGYLAIVAHNELGGRFLQVTEHHQGGPGFYLLQLWRGAQPAAACALASLLLLIDRKDSAARRLAVLAALALASLLLILSASRSKMEWYTTPMIPLVALLGSLGLSQAASRLADVRRSLGVAAYIAAAVVLAAGAIGAFVWVRAAPTRLYASEMGPQYGYGPFLAALAAGHERRAITAVDGGVFNDAGFADYQPMLRFDAALARENGLRIAVASPEAPIRAGALALTCDPSVLELWRDRYLIRLERRDPRCVLVEVEGERQAAP